jgi:hypothetical protein
VLTDDEPTTPIEADVTSAGATIPGSLIARARARRNPERMPKRSDSYERGSNEDRAGNRR